MIPADTPAVFRVPRKASIWLEVASYEACELGTSPPRLKVCSVSRPDSLPLRPPAFVAATSAAERLTAQTASSSM